MRFRPGLLARWVPIALALIAALSGAGVHDWLHELGVERAGHRPVADFEAHSSGCEHLGETPIHDGDHCVTCKAGAARQQAGLFGRGPQLAPVAESRVRGVDSNPRAFSAAIPGPLGARAPPVTVG